MIYINNYSIQKKKDSFCIISHEAVYCGCGSDVVKRGSKARYVTDNEGVRKRYILKRVYCQTCDKLHMVMPDFICPYKQYEKSVIDSVRNGTNDCSAADNTTLYRWKNQ